MSYERRREMKKAITSFSGEWGVLSNFSACEIELDGLVYASVEHAYQAAKTLEQRDREAIWLARKPGTAKALGQRVKLRPGWEGMKLGVMERLLRQKFSWETYAGERLRQTGDRELIEGNSWNDEFWGAVWVRYLSRELQVHACGDAGEWRGENHLGKILMKIRSGLIRGEKP
jgi:ribA/ribD-fused uncharacterized protein